MDPRTTIFDAILSISLSLALFHLSNFQDFWVDADKVESSDSGSNNELYNQTPQIQLELSCNSTYHCPQQVQYSICYEGQCYCDMGYAAQANKTCILKASHIAVKPEHMVPIMVVMGIMFIGVCVALNLFSRSLSKQQPSVVRSKNSNSPAPRYGINSSQSRQGRKHSGRLSATIPTSVESPSPHNQVKNNLGADSNSRNPTRSQDSSRNSPYMAQQTQIQEITASPESFV